jgi:hypothetical protein
MQVLRDFESQVFKSNSAIKLLEIIFSHEKYAFKDNLHEILRLYFMAALYVCKKIRNKFV